MKKAVSCIISAFMLILFSFSPISAVNRIRGDFNSDGTINAKDSFAIKRLLAGNSEEIDMSIADLNFDLAVNAKDSMILRRHLARVLEIRDISAIEPLPEETVERIKNDYAEDYNEKFGYRFSDFDDWVPERMRPENVGFAYLGTYNGNPVIWMNYRNEFAVQKSEVNVCGFSFPLTSPEKPIYIYNNGNFYNLLDSYTLSNPRFGAINKADIARIYNAAYIEKNYIEYRAEYDIYWGNSCDYATGWVIVKLKPEYTSLSIDDLPGINVTSIRLLRTTYYMVYLDSYDKADVIQTIYKLMEFDFIQHAEPDYILRTCADVGIS